MSCPSCLCAFVFNPLLGQNQKAVAADDWRYALGCGISMGGDGCKCNSYGRGGEAGDSVFASVAGFVCRGVSPGRCDEPEPVAQEWPGDFGLQSCLESGSAAAAVGLFAADCVDDGQGILR